MFCRNFLLLDLTSNCLSESEESPDEEEEEEDDDRLITVLVCIEFKVLGI